VWWSSLERAPERLTRREWGAVIAASLVAALSRVFALARTPWDWDELLFMRALDHFDVASHRPHPPGFPLFIGAAKIIRALGAGDFHALQALNFIAAIAIVPATVFLCRELRMRTSTSIAAALLLAFFPNVWVYGGGAFSDVPSMTLIVLAIALLFAGCRSPRMYLAGALMLAISAGVRPQNLLVGFAPFVIASMFRKWRDRIVAVVMITIVVGGSYAIAAWLTGWSQYREALQMHRAYIVRVDSFLSPTRPALWRVFVSFFVMPYRAPVINAIVTVLAVIGILRRRLPALLALAAFGPLCIFSWLMLDHFSASRFSIGYAPLIAILAAEGVGVLSIAVVIAMIVWTWPALAELRTTSPPVAAMETIPPGATVYVDDALLPFAQWYLANHRIEPATQMPAVFGEVSYWFHENESRVPKRRLWDIVRHRYFDVAASKGDAPIAFGDGWYGEERSGGQSWQWMSGHSVATLPPMSGSAQLSMRLYAPIEALGGPAHVTVRVNGKVVDDFVMHSSDIAREIVVRAHGDRPNELTIDTDRTVLPAAKHLSADSRVLGLRLNAMRWMAAQ
jgi:hypothetical protein